MDSGPGRQETLNHPVQLVSQSLEFSLDLRDGLPLPALAGLYFLPQPHLAGFHLLPQPNFTILDFAFQELAGGQ